VVAVDSNETVRVIDAFSGRQLRAWKAHYAGFSRDPVMATAVSADGDFAAIGLDNGRLVAVNTHTGAVRSLIGAQPEQNNLATTSISHIAWSPDGRDVAAIQGDGNVVVFSQGGQTLMRVQGLGAESLQFLLGSSALMGVDAQGTAHVWDVGSGSLLSNFPVEHFAPAGAVLFPDLGGGTSLTPVGTTKLLITDPMAYPALFDFALPRLLGDACRTAGRQLTRAEIQHLAAPAPAGGWSCR
jgi:WD40 repeat protein